MGHAISSRIAHRARASVRVLGVAVQSLSGAAPGNENPAPSQKLTHTDWESRFKTSRVRPPGTRNTAPSFSRPKGRTDEESVVRDHSGAAPGTSAPAPTSSKQGQQDLGVIVRDLSGAAPEPSSVAPKMFRPTRPGEVSWGVTASRPRRQGTRSTNSPVRVSIFTRFPTST